MSTRIKFCIYDASHLVVFHFLSRPSGGCMDDTACRLRNILHLGNMLHSNSAAPAIRNPITEREREINYSALEPFPQLTLPPSSLPPALSLAPPSPLFSPRPPTSRLFPHFTPSVRKPRFRAFAAMFPYLVLVRMAATLPHPCIYDPTHFSSFHMHVCC